MYIYVYSPVCNVIFLTFAGVLIKVESLPDGAKWVAKCSPIKVSQSVIGLCHLYAICLSLT